MSDLKVEIISPEGQIFYGVCHMAVIPATLGDIGVMHGHEAVITTLRQGEIMIYDNKNTLIKSLKIDDGFAEMQGVEKLLILIDSPLIM
jgi:F-type H+-transporting ATPase subunit epsilon